MSRSQKRVSGPLAKNLDLVQAAKKRALLARKKVPVKVYVDDEHWVFSLREQTAAHHQPDGEGVEA